jgi:hypothetical protein
MSVPVSSVPVPLPVSVPVLSVSLSVPVLVYIRSLICELCIHGCHGHFVYFNKKLRNHFNKNC